MQCPHCKQEHPEGAQFCPLTGKKIIIPQSCPQCGKPVDPNWLHCGFCGQKLIQAEGKFNQLETQGVGLPPALKPSPESPKTVTDYPKKRWPIITGGIGGLLIIAVIVIITIWNSKNNGSAASSSNIVRTTVTPTPIPPTFTLEPIPSTFTPEPIPPTATLTPTPSSATPIVCAKVFFAFNQEFVEYPLVQQGNENVYLPAEEPTKFHDNFSLPLSEDVFFRCSLAGNDVEAKTSAVAEDKTIIEIKEGPNGVIQMKGLKIGSTNVDIQVSGASYTFTGILVEKTPK
jgi:hypothetical protein